MWFNAFRKGHIYWREDMFSNKTEQFEETDCSQTDRKE